MTTGYFRWRDIARLGLVQASLGSVVVLATTVFNRIIVVEHALPAILPGALVALHYLVQVVRPRMGHGSDVGGRRTPWIVGGMVILALGGIGAAVATAWMGSNRLAGIALAAVAFTMIGIGVSASGTSLLALLAKRANPDHRSAAATMVWIMMIFGFAVTAGVAGHLLDPYSPVRLVAVTSGVVGTALVVTLAALFGLEGGSARGPMAQLARARERQLLQSSDPTRASSSQGNFSSALAEVWHEPDARRFTIFIFVSMLAYSAIELILEPFAGSVFGYTPGQSTSLSGVQHGAILVGMLLAALAGSRVAGRQFGSLRAWTIGGCATSGVAMIGLACAALIGQNWPFKATVILLGVANGTFSIAAIGSMMRLSSQGTGSREGIRMGLWGAAQAVAFGLGGLVGTGATDITRAFFGDLAVAYAAVFTLEAGLFVFAAILAIRVESTYSEAMSRTHPRAAPRGEHLRNDPEVTT